MGIEESVRRFFDLGEKFGEINLLFFLFFDSCGMMVERASDPRKKRGERRNKNFRVRRHPFRFLSGRGTEFLELPAVWLTDYRIQRRK